MKVKLEFEVPDNFSLGDCVCCPVDDKGGMNIACFYKPEYCPLVFAENAQLTAALADQVTEIMEGDNNNVQTPGNT